MYRAVALALSAMPMTLAIASLGLALFAVGGAQGSSGVGHPGPAAAATKDCGQGQRKVVDYPMICDPAYKANTASGVGQGSEPRCIVKPVLACKDAPSRRKYADSPALYRAGPWAQKKAPRDHAPVTVQRQMKPVTVSATPGKVASSSSVEWEPVASTPVKHVTSSSSSSGDWKPVALSPSQVPSSGEWVEVGDWKDMTVGGMGIPSDWRQVDDWEDVTASKKPAATVRATTLAGVHGSGRSSTSGKWEGNPRPSTSAHRGSSSGGQWEEVSVL